RFLRFAALQAIGFLRRFLLGMVGWERRRLLWRVSASRPLADRLFSDRVSAGGRRRFSLGFVEARQGMKELLDTAHNGNARADVEILILAKQSANGGPARIDRIALA